MILREMLSPISNTGNLRAASHIELVGDCIPAIVVLQDLNSMSNVYINKVCSDFFGHSSKFLLALGREYYNLYYPPEELRFFRSRMLELAEEADPDKLYSCFQRIRPRYHADFEWFFTNSRLYRSTDFNNVQLILHIAVRIGSMNYMSNALDDLMEQEVFIRERYHRLSDREKDVFKLIADGMKSKEIAEALFISPHTVNNHRKNIILKTGIEDLSILRNLSPNLLE